MGAVNPDQCGKIVLVQSFLESERPNARAQPLTHLQFTLYIRRFMPLGHCLSVEADTAGCDFLPGVIFHGATRQGEPY